MSNIITIYHRKTTKFNSIMHTMSMSMIMLIFLILATTTKTTIASSLDHTTEYNDFLRTETAIINTLRDYITNLEDKIKVIKRKTLEIKTINDEALENVDKYVSNPLNALTILKRFATDWNVLHKMASNVLNSTHEISKDIDSTQNSLKFPSEDDFDEAVGNLLRIQDIYKLEPKGLSLGEINGVKFGSEMSWSDCLEIGRKSDENGDYTVAKFWIEAAMGKLPTVDMPTTEVVSNNNNNNRTDADNYKRENGEIAKARFEILQALLNAEFHMGNFEAALEITDELFLLKPEHKGVLKAKVTIEKELKKETKRAKNKRIKKTQKAMMAQQKEKSKKTAEELLIEEMCRESTMLAPYRVNDVDNNKLKCYLEHGNLVELMLQPLKIEILSQEPYIVIQHDVLNEKQVDDLKNLIDETNNDADVDDEENDEYGGDNDDDNDDENKDIEVKLEFTNLAKQKLQRLNGKLELQTGHSSNLFDTWQPQRHSFDDEISTLEMDTIATLTTLKQKNILANVMLNLETSKLGGSIIFPQIELSLQIPQGSLLYWSNLNEFHEVDYRVKHHVCPVIAGAQITAVTTIRRI